MPGLGAAGLSQAESAIWQTEDANAAADLMFCQEVELGISLQGDFGVAVAAKPPMVMGMAGSLDAQARVTAGNGVSLHKLEVLSVSVNVVLLVSDWQPADHLEEAIMPFHAASTMNNLRYWIFGQESKAGIVIDKNPIAGFAGFLIEPPQVNSDIYFAVMPA